MLDPGAYNVVTREAKLGVEYRDPSEEVLKRIRNYIDQSAERMARQHQVDVEVIPGAGILPSPMDESMLEHLELAASDLGASSLRMPSGAGHDATMLAPLIPSAMMFVPSIGGRSHDISEDTREEDIVLGTEGPGARGRADHRRKLTLVPRRGKSESPGFAGLSCDSGFS